MTAAHVSIRETSSYDPAQILPLYQDAGWSNYTGHPAMLRAAWEHSLLALGAYVGERLVGIVRAVGDGASIVYIQDIIVHSQYQRQGIGSMLMRSMLARFSDAYQTVLLTDNTPKTSAFYHSLGFDPAETMNCCAFMRMNVQ